MTIIILLYITYDGDIKYPVEVYFNDTFRLSEYYMFVNLPYYYIKDRDS